MADEPIASRRDRVLTWLLRILGAVDLLAVGVVFLPNEFIHDVCQAVGFDPLTELPMAGYLIRSTSVLYALHGVLLIGMATDVVRYRPLIRLLGWLAMIHGGLLFYIRCSSRLAGLVAIQRRSDIRPVRIRRRAVVQPPHTNARPLMRDDVPISKKLPSPILDPRRKIE